MELKKLCKNTPTHYKMEKLINWSELSRFLTDGSRGGVRSKQIPGKHKKKVEELLKFIEDWKVRTKQERRH